MLFDDDYPSASEIQKGESREEFAERWFDEIYDLYGEDAADEAYEDALEVVG